MPGLDRERKVGKLLPGFVCTRAAKGAIDVVATRAVPVRHRSNGRVTLLSEVRFIQVKATAAGPFHHFGPADRRELLELAEKAGATAWLLWWPLRKQPEWIASADWPK